MDADPVRTRSEQEVAAVRDLQRAALLRAQSKYLLQLGRLAGALGPEKRERRVRCHHRPLFGGQKVARVLGCEPLSSKTTSVERRSQRSLDPLSPKTKADL